MHNILCINRKKKSFHVIVYKQARIWSIRTVTEQKNYEHSCNTTEKSTINYATGNAVLSLCSMNIAKNNWVKFKCTMRYFITNLVHYRKFHVNYTLLQCSKFPSELFFKSADCQNIYFYSLLKSFVSLFSTFPFPSIS